MYRRALPAAAGTALLALLGHAGCGGEANALSSRKLEPEFGRGGYYSVDLAPVLGQSTYVIVKVIGEGRFWLLGKCFDNEYRERPVRLDRRTLRVGETNRDGIGMPKWLIVKADFESWQPVYMGFEEELTESELEDWNDTRKSASWRRMEDGR